MRRLIVGLFLSSILLPSFVAAQSEAITRRDGFLMLWNSIRRATLENREPYFEDVPLGSPGEEEITYAKYRGIIDDDDDNFYPDSPLTLHDALLWLYRTRSVDDISSLTSENLAALRERFPVTIPGEITLSDTLTAQQLLSMMQSLDDFLMKEDHEVSLYSEKFHGKGTAFGESFDMHALTAAHRTFPHNTLVKVTNIANGKSVTVRINDRGPYVDGRDMDLSLASFLTIEERSKGILRATFQRLGDATFTEQCDDTDTRRALRITKGVHLIGGVPVEMPLGKDLVFRSTRPFVLRSVLYPDGTFASIQDWILPGESHPFTPSITGEYVFTLASKEGRTRAFKMTVLACK